MKEHCFYSCQLVNNLTLTIDGRIDIDRKSLGFCREALKDIPALSLSDTPEEIIENYYRMREAVLSEGKKKLDDPTRVITRACVKCFKYRSMPLPEDDLIRCIKVSMYPALCQCKCIYCTSAGYDMIDLTQFSKPSVTENYEKAFSTMEYARKIGKLAPDVVWYLMSGEITMHPYKNRIYDMVGHDNAWFFTNCFKYDERIAENLSANKNSCICFSIDAGTAETWTKVKGVNNFAHIIKNLGKYREVGNQPGQIALKYIVLPGINDSLEDFMAIAELMKLLNIAELEISRDYSITGKYNTYYGMTDRDGQKLINSVANLVNILYKDGFTMRLYYAYSPNEREQILSIVNELSKQ